MIIKYRGCNTYREFLDETFELKNKRLGKNIKSFLNLIVNTFILITYFIMIAGFGAYLNQEFGVNQMLGSAVLAAITFCIGTGKSESIIKINQYIVPTLVLLILVITLISLNGTGVEEIKNSMLESKQGYMLTGIIYASYNTILLIPILITLGKNVGSKIQIKKIAICSSMVILILAYAIFFMLTKIDVDISKLEMPAVYAVSLTFNIFRYVYGVILLLAIFTTSISLQKSFLQNVVSDKVKIKSIAFLMGIIGVLVSRIGFANLVNYLYQLLGYLGLIQIYRIAVIKIKKRFPQFYH